MVYTAIIIVIITAPKIPKVIPRTVPRPDKRSVSDMRYEGYVARATASLRYPKEVKARNGIANHRNMANILFEKCQRAIATSPRIPNKESRGAQYEIRVVPEQKSQPFSPLALAEIQ